MIVFDFILNFDPAESNYSQAVRVLLLRLKINMKSLEAFLPSSFVLGMKETKTIFGGDTTDRTESHQSTQGNCPDVYTVFTRDTNLQTCSGETCTMNCP